MPSTAELICVDPARIDEMWPHVRDLIRAAVEATELCDFDLTERDVLAGDLLLWVAWDGKSILAAATTRISGNNSRKRCVITSCAGHGLEEWVSLRSGIEKYAKDEGCFSVRTMGRMGWKHVLTDYRAEYVVLEKRL
jgi:hypothetical protein